MTVIFDLPQAGGSHSCLRRFGRFVAMLRLASAPARFVLGELG
jgi:hypothetical protein